MTTTHDSQVSVDVTLGPATSSEQGFGVLLFLDSASDLGGDTHREYSDSDDALADEDAGDLSSMGLAFVTATLSQMPRPEKVLVGAVDTTGSSYVDDLSDIAQLTDEFYGVGIDSRDDADIVDVAEYVETTNLQFFAQSSEEGLLSAGLPSGLEDLEDLERTSLVYHDDDDEPAVEAWAASRLVHNPDDRSAPWTGQVRAISSYASPGLTGAEASAAKANNVNLILPFGDVSTYVFDGVNMAGRDIYEIVSLDWFTARLKSRVTLLKQEYDSRGLKIPISASGQNILRGEIQAQIDQGIAAGHFSEDTPDPEFPDPIPAADITAGELKAEGEIIILESARSFPLTFFFTN